MASNNKNKYKEDGSNELQMFTVTVKFFGGRTTQRSVWSTTKEGAIIEARGEFSEEELRFIDEIY